MASLGYVILACVLRIAPDDNLLALSLDMCAAIFATQVLSHCQNALIFMFVLRMVLRMDFQIPQFYQLYYYEINFIFYF